MSGIKYYLLLKDCKEGILLREQMVLYAIQHGIKPTARAFLTSKNTVKKWLKRYLEEGFEGLRSRSRRPKHSPKKAHPYVEERVLHMCKEMTEAGKRLTATYVYNNHTFHCSIATIRRIMRKNGYCKKKKSNRNKRDLSAQKAQLQPLQRVQTDVKYLDDIPEMFPDLIMHKLPLYQFTARDMRTGALFICYAREKTVHNAIIFMRMVAEHFRHYKMSIENTIIQTDNGVEFVQNMRDPSKSKFTESVEHDFLMHRKIPVGAKTWQSDVETSHRLIEDEFYAVKSFSSCKQFLQAAQHYVEWFNCGRHNRNKDGTPLEIWRKYDKDIPIGICKFKPVILDNYFDKYFDCA
jgi:transposase